MYHRILLSRPPLPHKQLSTSTGKNTLSCFLIRQVFTQIIPIQMSIIIYRTLFNVWMNKESPDEMKATIFFSKRNSTFSHFTHRHLIPTVLKLSSSSLVISCLNYFILQWLYRSFRMLKKVTYENTEVGIERKHRFVKDTRIKISCIAQIIKY